MERVGGRMARVGGTAGVIMYLVRCNLPVAPSLVWAPRVYWDGSGVPIDAIAWRLGTTYERCARIFADAFSSTNHDSVHKINMRGTSPACQRVT